MAVRRDRQPLELEALFRANYWTLVRIVSGSVGEEAAAEVVQEAFAQAYRHWNRVQNYDDPVSWIRHVALRRAMNESRRVANSYRLVERLTAGVQPVLSAENDERVLTAESIQGLLVRLPSRQRLIVSLFYVHDWSVERIAEEAGISSGTVKSALSRARTQLRRELEGTTQ